MSAFLNGTLSGMTRSDLAAETGIYNIPTEAWRVFDTGAPLPLVASISADDLGIGYLAFGTGLVNLNAGDLKGTTSTRYARAQFTLPPEYVSAGTVTLRAMAGMLTTVAGTSCVIDFEAYLSNGDTTKTGGDLVTTSAQSMNSLTFATYSFNVTATSLVPGSVLDIRVTITTVDAVNATAVTPAIAHIKPALEIKG